MKDNSATKTRGRGAAKAAATTQAPSATRGARGKRTIGGGIQGGQPEGGATAMQATGKTQPQHKTQIAWLKKQIATTSKLRDSLYSSGKVLNEQVDVFTEQLKTYEAA